ncbi:MAG: alpha/beta fold hydrolase [Candidatus Baltobacteraceae bacterium]
MQIAIDDTKLDVTTAGSGDAAVLLHGFPFSHEIWNSQIERLANSHFVIAPDLRGLGKSQAGGGPYLMETLAGDLAAILDALGVERANLVGHSLGGYVSLAFFRMFSERVSRMALLCSRIDADTTEIAQNRLNMADQAEQHGMLPILQRNADSYFAPQTSRDVRARATEIMQQTNPRGAAAMLRGMSVRVSSDDLVDELDVPVLIIAGGQDTISPPAIWDDITPRLRDGKMEVFKATAHLPMMEEPERLSESLMNFLQLRAGKS